jgi:uncharacterized protein (DUF58 family)
VSAELPTLDPIASEALLRRLELTVRNRLDGLLTGDYTGLVPGPGSEAGEARPYIPGDDVRRMDWAVTARTNTAHVRQTIADRELETWLVVDISPSLDFGTARSEKRELVLAALSAVTYLTVRGGNRVGAVISNGVQTVQVPAQAGRAHAQALLRIVAATPRAHGADVPALPAALELLRRPIRRRGLVVIASDFLDGTNPAGASGDEPTWQRPLRSLSQRHQLLGVEIVDPRELELPAAGLVTFVDPETGRLLEVQTSQAQVRRDFATAAAAQRERIASGLRRAGAAHLQLRTDRDWVSDVVRFVLAQRRMAAGTGIR